jgi:hypothetical protein
MPKKSQINEYSDIFAHSGGGLDVELMRVEFWVFVGVAEFLSIAQLSVGFV